MMAASPVGMSMFGTHVFCVWQVCVDGICCYKEMGKRTGGGSEQKQGIRELDAGKNGGYGGW